MLSSKVLSHLKNIVEMEPPAQLVEQYKIVLKNLEIPLDSPFSLYNLKDIGPTFIGRSLIEINNVCWFSIYSSYDEYLDFTWNKLSIPRTYIPLDEFVNDEGFFYNRSQGSVALIETPENFQKIQQGEMTDQWSDFNLFLEWFYELTPDSKETEDI